MIETIRLFRKKEQDIWALYIVEFFKFVGCFICDCELRERRVLALKFDDEYDVNLFFGVSPKDVMLRSNNQEEGSRLKGRNISVEIPSDPTMQELLHSEPNHTTVSGKLLKEFVEQIWDDETEQTVLLFLSKVYCENNLFFYLYNEGNRKFVQEQHYSLKIRQSLKEALVKTAELSFDHFRKGYNSLYQRVQKESEERLLKNSPYYSYAQIVLMYKLNQKMMTMEEGNVFKIESLLERAESVMENSPDFIRINYLAGSICREKEGYYRKAERYFIKTLKMLEKKKVNGLSAFVYYRLGNLEDSIFKHEEIAQMCYRNAYHWNDEYHPVMLKIAEMSNPQKGIKLCNEVIRILMNGYFMEQVMPKQQIYAYEAFKMLGDIFKRYDDYDTATQCYQNAKKLAETRSEFFGFFDENGTQGFYEIVLRSMPTEPILYRLIECALHEGDREQVEKYFDEM